ncbi:exo-beta-1,4-galactosidase [Ferruginibacter sp.]|nr:beta-glucuronidase [Ferruginibacter sp.]
MQKHDLSRHFKIFLLVVLAGNFYVAHAQTISLAGQWYFKADSGDMGVAEKWFSKKLTDSIVLPGSMLTNNKGDEVTLQTPWTGSIYDSSWYFIPRFAKYRQPGNLKFPFWLTPKKYYVGAAWYQKEISIPASWKNKHISLFLERCHTETEVWVDDKRLGLQNSMVAPHEYELNELLSAGKHVITIKVDNRIKDINVGPDSHSLTDHTQGNWNGIIGKITLEATAITYIEDAQIYPDIKNKQVKIKLHIEGDPSQIKNITLAAATINLKWPNKIKPVTISSGIRQNEIELLYPMGNNFLLWDEFEAHVYEFSIRLNFKKGEPTERKLLFGMRDFKISGTHFTVNGKPVFLRGTVDCAVFPLTGFPPAKKEDWIKIFTIAKEHGLNHMRFHSWCPPEAAFAAADLTGFYLQPEAPTWPNHGVSIGDNKPIDQFIYDETNRMVKAYGNHPSFCMLASGNEPAGKNQAKYLAGFIQYWKQKDSRRVYTGASVGISWPLVPENEYMVKSGARNLNWTTVMPENKTDYLAAIEKYNVPYVTHEMGQWCVFPDFTEIKKYTGVYKAKNFEMFEEDLNDQGMGDEAAKFHLASGKLQVICYKNEIEKTLRTPGLGGFQLLGLQDFPGQGTALVGTMNPFWENKKYITTKEFSSFCNATVPLIRTGKFVYTNNETFTAAIEVFHSGDANLSNATVLWKLKDQSGTAIESGKFSGKNIVRGKNTIIDTLQIALQKFIQAQQLTLQISIEKTYFNNEWKIWVYPAQLPLIANDDIYYTDTLDTKANAILEKGGKVFLNIAGKVVKGKEVAQTFLPVFWNTSWFKMRPPHTLGILVNEKAPVFNMFPTGFHSDIQWWEIVNKTQVMHLEDFSKDFKPLIRPIDTWFMNRRLALLFEAKLGNGKIMVTSIDLLGNLKNKPAAAQLLYSIKKYMMSNSFDPSVKIDAVLINDLVSKPSAFVFNAYTKATPDELKPKTIAQ